MNKRNYWKGEGMVKSIKKASIFDKRKGIEYEVTDILLSIKETIKGKDKFTIVPLEAWGNMSNACQNLREGQIIQVEGHFANKKWKDADDVERKLNVIVVESVG